VSKNENENRHYIEKDILIWEMENSKEEDRLLPAPHIVYRLEIFCYG
jgi:hypothetical protein